MAEITLVRHGQANSHASDEKGYDQLSELGKTQARWLGQHFSGRANGFDRVITGTLTRQVETAKYMGFENFRCDHRLDELPYFDLVKAVQREHNLPEPKEASEFVRFLPEMIELWAQDKVQDAPRSFEEFAGAVKEMIDEQCESTDRVLLVTSGGVISMAVRHALGLDIAGMSKIMLHISNSSVHTLRYVHETLMLGGFNATPHLDAPERSDSITYI
ncbi:MAG: histidine phosphatase family protein [Pseudomonadota bacterium]